LLALSLANLEDLVVPCRKAGVSNIRMDRDVQRIGLSITAACNDF